MSRNKPILIAIIVIFLVSGCSQDSDTLNAKVEKPESPSLIICRDVINLGKEVDKGIITDFELRDEYKLIYEKAIGFGDAELLSTTTKVLAAVTKGNKTEYSSALRVFFDLCSDRIGTTSVIELFD
jgi:hypothetical protein